MRVLIVDDSVIFRTQVNKALSAQPGIEVVGVAANGKIALEKIQQGSVDLIILDLEMPDVDGIKVLSIIREKKIKVHSIVFSSPGVGGAAKGIEALRLGASDIVVKPETDSMVDLPTIAQAISAALLPKIRQFEKMAGSGSRQQHHKKDSTIEKKSPPSPKPSHATVSDRTTQASIDWNDVHPKAIVIGSSTGGPAALETIFSNLVALTNQPLVQAVPIFIVQHMPPVFTTMLAARLSEISKLSVTEARHHEEVVAGRVYVAPGNYHLSVNRIEKRVVCQLDQTAQRNSVRPAVDILFESAADVYRRDLVAIVLTGMGEDGLVGCRKVKSTDGKVLIQDKESCVVFGMPGAVYADRCFDDVANLQRITEILKKLMQSR